MSVHLARASTALRVATVLVVVGGPAWILSGHTWKSTVIDAALSATNLAPGQLQYVALAVCVLLLGVGVYLNVRRSVAGPARRSVLMSVLQDPAPGSVSALLISAAMLMLGLVLVHRLGS